MVQNPGELSVSLDLKSCWWNKNGQTLKTSYHRAVS